MYSTQFVNLHATGISTGVIRVSYIGMPLAFIENMFSRNIEVSRKWFSDLEELVEIRNILRQIYFQHFLQEYIFKRLLSQRPGE